MKRFAVEDDREFEVVGEVFKWVYPHWEDIAAMFDRDSAEATTNGNEPETMRVAIGDLIERIAMFIDPDYNNGRERWFELTKRRQNPVPHSMFPELYRWLLEATSGRYPTPPSSDSADGQPTTVATSTGESS